MNTIQFDDCGRIVLDRRAVPDAISDERALARSFSSRPPFFRSALALVLLGAVLALTLLAGCHPDTARAVELADAGPDAITAADLVGRYRVYDGAYPSYVQFDADSSFLRAGSRLQLDSNPIDYGVWSLAGEELLLTSDISLPTCEGGRSGRYRLSRYETGGYLFVRLAEACAARLGFVPTADSHPWQASGLLCRVDGETLCDRD